MAKKKGFREERTIITGGINTTARVPVCLCLDVSGSMQGHPINELNAGVRMFYDAIRKDEMAFSAADIAIVTFGGNREAKCVQGFSQLWEVSYPPTLTAAGLTPMGEAVTLALDLLDSRKAYYKKNAYEHYQPWLVLMSDGYPEGSDKNVMARAASRTCEMVQRRKLTVFAIGIGNAADRDALARFSPNRPPVKLKGLNFQKFFEWLSQSMSEVSEHEIGAPVRLPSPEGWAEPWRTL